MAEPILKMTRGVPKTDREWMHFFRLITKFFKVSGDELQIGGDIALPPGSVGTAELEPDSVTNDKLRDSAGLSVMGRASASGGSPADIVATVSDTFMVRRGGALTWDVLEDGDIPVEIARDTDVSDAIAAHVAETDPHPQYLTQLEGDDRYVRQSNVLSGSSIFNPPSIPDGDEVSTTVAVAGALPGDFAVASFEEDLQGMTINAAVTAGNTVTVVFRNGTGAAVDIGSGALRARVWRA